MTRERKPQAEPLTALADWRLPGRGEAAVDLAFRHRVKGVQFDLGGPGRGPWLDAPGHLARLARTARCAGVLPLGLAGNVLNDIGLTAAQGTLAAGRVRDVLGRLLDAAGELGAPLVFVPSFRQSAIDGEAALHRTAEVLRAAAEQAGAVGIRLASENTLAPEAALWLAEQVASPAFRLLLDTYNPRQAGVDPAALVAATGAHLADQIHVKDGPADSDTTPLLGDGDGSIGDTLDAVARYGRPVRALVLENDHRGGDTARLTEDLDRLRVLATRLHGRTAATGTAEAAGTTETAGTWASY
ncbi:sugar phosphate isomerase/epimerase family protein [Streptomyces sp. NPDC087263]|uniref:sugar phosphate isomerase/epimerase family protein n=1 Tax=Streptomyces sp. NPDC087263 TaxID=3365773 RepID=UPI003800E29B